MSPGRPHTRVVASLIALIGALGVCGASAQAATVVVGSPMTSTNLAPGTIGDSGNTQTIANTALGEAGAHVASPVDGTIISWRVSANGTGNYGIRILRPAGGDQYTGGPTTFQAVTSPDPPPAAHTFSASIPIKAGDLIGLDIPPGNGVNGYTPDPGSQWDAWDPALPEGSTSAPDPIGSPGTEMAFNATVQYPDPPGSGSTTPTKKKKCKKKKKHKRSAESAKKKKCKKKKKH